MRTLKGDQSTVRALNRSVVLNLLRREGQLSRVRLKDLSGLSGAAVTGVVADLMTDGLVVEREVGASSGGRPPILLELNYAARVAVGAKLMVTHLQAVLTDLGTRVLANRDEPLADTRPETVAAAVSRAAARLLADAGVPRSRLVGVGVGMPGVIDPSRGVAVHSPMLGWREVPIERVLEDALGCPVHADNDVNAFAAAERLFGHGRSAAHLAVVTVGRGIGAGLVLNGVTYRGRDGGAGELGHTVVEPGGRPCECGKRGCLEAYASEPAILERALEAHPDLGEGGPLTVERLLAAAAGHDGAREVLRDAGRRVGIALANLVNLVNPELIVVGGEGVRLGPAFLDPMRQALSEHAFDGLGVGLPVIVDPWGDDAWARGAAALAVTRTFDWS